jgi:hypothetical protein
MGLAETHILDFSPEAASNEQTDKLSKSASESSDMRNLAFKIPHFRALSRLGE